MYVIRTIENTVNTNFASVNNYCLLLRLILHEFIINILVIISFVVCGKSRDYRSNFVIINRCVQANLPTCIPTRAWK